jgi:hypothetical protein
VFQEIDQITDPRMDAERTVTIRVGVPGLDPMSPELRHLRRFRCNLTNVQGASAACFRAEWSRCNARLNRYYKSGTKYKTPQLRIPHKWLVTLSVRSEGKPCSTAVVRRSVNRCLNYTGFDQDAPMPVHLRCHSAVAAGMQTRTARNPQVIFHP